MRDQFLVVATGIEQGVGQYRQPVEGPLLVDAFGQAAHGAVVPGEDGSREGRRRAEGVSDEFLDEVQKVDSDVKSFDIQEQVSRAEQFNSGLAVRFVSCCN